MKATWCQINGEAKEIFKNLLSDFVRLQEKNIDDLKKWL
mgnify:CR=1 FL=1